MELFHVEARSTIYRWLQTGKLPPPVKRWGSPLWDLDEVKEHMSGDSEKSVLQNVANRRIS